MDDEQLKVKHSDVTYDYIKFHLGLYIATPPVIAIVATALGVQTTPAFQRGMIGLVIVFFIAGVCASWFIASHINRQWDTSQQWIALGERADDLLRRALHHYLYWIGLIVGLGGMFLAWWMR